MTGVDAEHSLYFPILACWQVSYHNASFGPALTAVCGSFWLLDDYRSTLQRAAKNCCCQRYVHPAFVLCDANTQLSLATIPLIFLYYFFYDIAYSPMLVAYTLEILPYKIRAKGFALMVCTDSHLLYIFPFTIAFPRIWLSCSLWRSTSS